MNLKPIQFFLILFFILSEKGLKADCHSVPQAQSLWSQAHYDQAKHFLSSSLEKSAKCSPPERAEAYYLLGTFSYILADYLGARDAFAEAKSLYATIPNMEEMVGECWYQLGRTSLFLKGMGLYEYRDSIHWLLGGQHPISLKANVLNSFIKIYEGALEGAIDILDTTLWKIREWEVTQCTYLGDTYNYVGIIYKKYGDLDMALQFYEKSAEAYSEFPYQHPSEQLGYDNNLALVYLNLKDYVKAKTLLFKTYRQWKKLGLEKADRYSILLSNLSIAYLATGQADSATVFLKEALNFVPLVEDAFGRLGKINSLLSETYLAQGDTVNACNYWENARDIFSQPDSFPDDVSFFMPTFLKATWKLFEAHKCYELGLYYVEEFLNKTRESPLFGENIPFHIDQGHSLIGIITALAFHNYRLFLESSYKPYRKRALVYLNHALGSFYAWETYVRSSNSRKIYFREYEDLKNTALFIYSNEPDTENLKRAFSIMEHWKNNVYFLQTAPLFRDNALRLPGQQKDREWQQRIVDKKRQIHLLENSGQVDSLKRAREEWSQLQQEYQLYLQNWKIQQPTWYRLFNASLDRRLAEEQNKLGKQEVLLEFATGSQCFYRFTITTDTCFLDRIMVDSSLDAQINTLKEWISNYQDPAFEKDQGLKAGLENLKNRLLPLDFLKENRPEFMRIVPDGSLTGLPMELFFLQDENFAEKSSGSAPNIYYGYTGTNERPSKKCPTSLSYAGWAPQFSDSLSEAEGLAPLLFNQEEVKTAAETMRGIAFLGGNANRQSFFSKAPLSRIIHVSTHTSLNPDNPFLSYFHFNTSKALGDGRVYGYELMGMNICADLAVLSSCHSGEGKQVPGEGVVSLAKTLKLAGCSNAVMSLWQANDWSTRQIIDLFFKELKRGKSGPQALLDAKIRFLQSVENPVYKQPFYWAHLVYYGSPEDILEEKSVSTMAATSAIVILIFVIFWIGWLFFKRK